MTTGDTPIHCNRGSFSIWAAVRCLCLVGWSISPQPSQFMMVRLRVLLFYLQTLINLATLRMLGVHRYSRRAPVTAT
jgi:hypothetical protein